MLGTGLGKKVDAQFVKEEYKTFLIGGNEKPKKPLTKEEKRAEWRKKGIFVAADDEDFVPTIFERPSTSLRPAVCKEKTKQLRWKKKTVRQVNKNPSDISMKTPDTSADSSSKQTNSVVATKEKKKKPKKNSELTKREISKKGYELSLAENMGEGSKNEKKKKKWEEEEEQKVSPNPKRSLREELNITTARSSIVIEESPTQCQSVSVPEPSSSSSSSVTGALSIQEDCPTAKEMVSTATENSAPKSSNASNSLSYTLRQPVQMATTPVEKDDVFGKMEDDEFEKVLAQENSFAVADKEAVMTARKILQVAYKEKAFEKALTKEENDILVQFFSGKIPYNDKVLKTLDKALDKTIDWMKTNKVKMTDETKALINKRSAVKAAMFEAILTSPQYIPKSWAKKYEELRAQSRKETQGINWARVLLCYPNQKMFGDGPEDQFGNFTRQKRNWILGILIGPSDSKTFEETQREEDCKGMYFDTGIMEKAKKHADEDVSTMTAVSSMMKR